MLRDEDVHLGQKRRDKGIPDDEPDEDLFVVPLYNEHGQVTGILPLPAICDEIARAMENQDIFAVMEQINWLRRYAEEKTVIDCHCVRESGLLKHLLVLAHCPTGEIDYTSREIAMFMYAQLICSEEKTDLPELAKDSGHLNGLFEIVLQEHIPERMEEPLAKTILAITRHCEDCRVAVLKTITGDILDRIGQFSTPTAAAYKFIITAALCQGPVSDPDFAHWALECFRDRLTGPDDEAYDALVGLAHWIRYIPIRFPKEKARRPEEEEEEEEDDNEEEEPVGIPVEDIQPLINGCAPIVANALCSPLLDWKRPALRIIKETYARGLEIAGLDIASCLSEMFVVAINSVVAEEPERKAEDDPEWEDWVNSSEAGMILATDIANTLTVVMRDPRFVGMLWEEGLIVNMIRAFSSVSYKCKDSLTICLAHAARSGIPMLQRELIMSHVLVIFVDAIADQSGRDHTLLACLLAIQHLVGYAASCPRGDEDARLMCENDVMNDAAFEAIEELFDHEHQGISNIARELLDFLQAPEPPRPVFGF